MAPELCVLRGAGDLATGVAWRLGRAGWPVIACELPEPLAVRTTVALSSAVSGGTVSSSTASAGSVDIEGMRGQLVASLSEAFEVARQGTVAVLVSPELPALASLPLRPEASVIIDARLAKRNLDTKITDGGLVVGLGPGFMPGHDCHAVIETQRGHHLGRVFWDRSAAPNTGTPGIVGGRGKERVLRATSAGLVQWDVAIGQTVTQGQILGTVGPTEVTAPFAGVVRGLIAAGIEAQPGLKVGDVDPRCDADACHEISDKALAIGGGVVDAVQTWLRGG